MQRILLTDDHDVLLFGTSIILKEIIPKAEIHFSYSLQQALSILSNEKFDLILLDIDIPGGNNVGMIQKIKKLSPSVRILMFSSYDERIYAISYLQAGADGYLNKHCSKKQLQIAVNEILTGKQYFSSEVRDILFDAFHNKKEQPLNEFNSLSIREAEVMKLMALGKGTSEIAHELNLKLTTISTFRNRIFEKLRVSNLVELLKKIENLKTQNSIPDFTHINH